MYQSFQKKLLLQYPLIWNTKFVPMLIFGFFLHLVFFGLGYIDGTIDFSDKNNIQIEVASTFFGLVIVILVFIIWLVFYFKNNALKSFYRKSKYSLFYEFFQILVICTLLVTFYIPFTIGKQFHQASYYSLEETQKRCKTIASADIFIDGNFRQTSIDSLASGLIDSLGNLTEKAKRYERNYNYESSEIVEEVVDVVVDADDNTPIKYKEYIIFNGKKYHEFSLMNRQIYTFSVSEREKDSIIEKEVKNWLYTNDSQTVKKLMRDYLDILNEHQLETNLTLDNWFKAVYNYPDFKDFLYIHPYKNKYEANPRNTSHYYYYDDIDSKYSKYFVQQDVLKEKYDIVSDAHTENYINYNQLLSFLYLGLIVSILILSFRITSGKSWLISVVITGILNILSGIFAAILSEETVYFCCILFFIILFNSYFAVIYFRKESKKFSYIALNTILWGNPFIIPLIYFCIKEYYTRFYYDPRYEGYYPDEYFWLSNNVSNMFWLNYLLVIITVALVAKIIRNWKGITEN